ncbi:3-hydroxybutyryl-CoA dehydrogenase [Symbiobacterium thermophilum]|uniref:3-hydroxybutyryl-CoA dehydrogenase n=1 Tax=Symbiobacterium thermophilum (strain DSM 24528 / JCM 14929 / IAM 14863 / T) TaxID=292459 RepID=Q67KA3_SYMTH|nr:3-hydroxybutyryl-CoA dehydrogenase [Symbiobacterium thermophilum]BAD41895.1 3-hydroxybutyryl-CoA dehydrogenase [Symbiobacterium thermophilum IAM 14863]
MIKRVMVVGAGQMGSGIAQVAAQAGLQVWLRDLEPRFVERGLGVIEKNLARDVAKGRRTEEEKAAILGRITGTTELGPAAECDLVIEAIVESLEAKLALFRELDSICPEVTLFASNTSSLPITQLAAVTRRPDRFIGMHFMNPVPVMKLVEVIRGIATSDETYAAIRNLAEAMGKTPVEVNDFPGFVSNRVLMPMLNEAMFCVYEGIAGVEEVDTVMKLGMNHPMGPLTLADFIGLDTCLAILNVLYEGFKDPKYRPCPLLVQMVQAGYLGRKSGRGFYIYDENGATPMKFKR